MNYKISYNEYRQCGSLRSMLNRTHNSKFITPELQEFLEFRLKDEAKFHTKIWKKLVAISVLDLILQTKSKRERFEKILSLLEDVTSYEDLVVEAAIKAAGKGKGYWETREVSFPTKENATSFMNLANGSYGYIRKATKASKPSHLIDLEVDEFENGIWTGKTVLVTYDKESHRRYLHGYKKTREEEIEEIKEFYEEDEEILIL